MTKTAKQARDELVKTVAADAKELEEIVAKESTRRSQRVRQHTTEFVDFIREKGVAGLAVGIVIGTGVTALVNSLVIDIINPLLGLVMPDVDKLTDSSLHLFSAEIRLGAFVVALINFLVIALTIFAAFKVFKLDRLDRQKSK